MWVGPRGTKLGRRALLCCVTQLRDQKNHVEEDTRKYCLICGQEANLFDRVVEGGFAGHVKDTHNMWQYLNFMVYLNHKSEDEYTGMPQSKAFLVETKSKPPPAPDTAQGVLVSGAAHQRVGLPEAASQRTQYSFVMSTCRSFWSVAECACRLSSAFPPCTPPPPPPSHQSPSSVNNEPLVNSRVVGTGTFWHRILVWLQLTQISGERRGARRGGCCAGRLPVAILRRPCAGRPAPT